MVPERDEAKEFVLKTAKENDEKFIRLLVLRHPWHFEGLCRFITVKDLEDALERGVGFDGSSIKGFVRFDECDMIAMPDTSTAYVDPFFKILTLTMMCNVLGKL